MPNPQWPSIALPNLEYTSDWEDPTIRTDTDGGYVLTRRGHTRIRRTWRLVWNAMGATDRGTFFTFYTGSAGAGAVIFDWTSTTDGTSVHVRFAGPPKEALICPASGRQEALYRVECELAEV